MHSTLYHIVVFGEDIPGGLESHPERPYPVQSARTWDDYVALLLQNSLDRVAILDEPIYFFIPQAFVLVKIHLELLHERDPHSLYLAVRNGEPFACVWAVIYIDCAHC